MHYGLLAQHHTSCRINSHPLPSLGREWRHPKHPWPSAAEPPMRRLILEACDGRDEAHPRNLSQSTARSKPALIFISLHPKAYFIFIYTSCEHFTQKLVGGDIAASGVSDSTSQKSVPPHGQPDRSPSPPHTWLEAGALPGNAPARRRTFHHTCRGTSKLGRALGSHVVFVLHRQDSIPIPTKGAKPV